MLDVTMLDVRTEQANLALLLENTSLMMSWHLTASEQRHSLVMPAGSAIYTVHWGKSREFHPPFK
jgi:hypothetical protein